MLSEYNHLILVHLRSQIPAQLRLTNISEFVEFIPMPIGMSPIPAHTEFTPLNDGARSTKKIRIDQFNLPVR